MDGDELREIRELIDLTKSELAEALQWDEDLLADYEIGRVPVPEAYAEFMTLVRCGEVTMKRKSYGPWLVMRRNRPR